MGFASAYDFTRTAPIDPNWIMWPRRRRLRRHREGRQFPLRTVLLLPREHAAPDKISFVQRNEKSDARLDRRGVLIQLVAVKRITNFRAQRVARAQTCGLQAT